MFRSVVRGDRGDSVGGAASAAKSDAAKLTFQAEVDWGRFGSVLGIAARWPGLFWHWDQHSCELMSKSQPLRIYSTSPTSWLTSIAAIGSLLTALASTTGLPKGLFGSDALPQQTLILGAAAISLPSVGVAALITGVPTAREPVEGKLQTCPRAMQFVIGAGLSGAAAALQILAVTTAAQPARSSDPRCGDHRRNICCIRSCCAVSHRVGPLLRHDIREESGHTDRPTATRTGCCTYRSVGRPRHERHSNSRRRSESEHHRCRHSRGHWEEQRKRG